jgi:hypothetical protein
LVAFGSVAQVTSDDPDWKETEAPPPPAFNKDKLISIEMPKYVSLAFGVDPATLVITPDGIVRYVVVAINQTGSVSAMYEGIQCSTGNVKTYARLASNGQWSLVTAPQWHDMYDKKLPSRHAKALARQGICEGRAMAASSVAEIVKSLKNPTYGQTQ